jgi:hypothetical protein
MSSVAFDQTATDALVVPNEGVVVPEPMQAVGETTLMSSVAFDQTATDALVVPNEGVVVPEPMQAVGG